MAVRKRIYSGTAAAAGIGYPYHEDHSGNGAAILNELKIPVFAPSLSLGYLAAGYPLQLYRRVIWGIPQNYRAEPLPPVLELEDNLSLQVLAAPGHAPDVTCFLIPERGWLFSGDLYIAPHPQYSRQDEDYPQQIESLRRVLRYDFDVIFCAHRGIVKNGHQALQNKLDYLVSLRERIQDMHRQGKPLKVIKQTLLGREGSMSWITFFHFSKRNLILSLLSEKEAET
jgi:glyoxylase-like metal-dependent hydrolase (beta-lactamase superfamily II)